MPHWDTKKAYKLLTEDGDLVYFITRELGARQDYFTDEQEDDLRFFLERMLDTTQYAEKSIRLHRIDYTILTLKLLLALHEDILEYQYYKGLIQEFPTPAFYRDFDHE